MIMKLVLFFLLLHYYSTLTLTLAQVSSMAPALAPAVPALTNVTKILEKAGQFTIFIGLMKSTRVSNQLPDQLKDSNNGITILAPSNDAFSTLKSGTLNSLSDEQKVKLVQFHIVPTYISSSQFQTISNPVRTQAGDSGDGNFPLNVTTDGNSVNLTSGLTNTSVSATVFTDGQVAVYQIDKVLQPSQIFDPRPPAPAPAPENTKKKREIDMADSPDDDSTTDKSKAVRFTVEKNVGLLGISVIILLH